MNKISCLNHCDCASSSTRCYIRCYILFPFQDFHSARTHWLSCPLNGNSILSGPHRSRRDTFLEYEINRIEIAVGRNRYRQKGTVVEYVVFSLLLFLCWGVLSITISPFLQYLEVYLSVFLPAWISQEALINALISHSPTQLSITLFLAIFLSSIVAPIVDELYFRGFLLTRMEHWGRAAPVVNSFLFAVYHSYFPGNVLGIFLAFLPISYVVSIMKNWIISAITLTMFICG